MRWAVLLYCWRRCVLKWQVDVALCYGSDGPALPAGVAVHAGVVVLESPFDSVELWHMGMAVQAEWQQGWQLRGILTVAKAWSRFLVAISVFMSAVGLKGGDIV